MSECDRDGERARCEAALEGFFEVAQSWEFELAWKLCWLEKDFADAGWRGGPPDPSPPGRQRFTPAQGGEGDPRHDAVRDECGLLTSGPHAESRGDRGAPYSVENLARLLRAAGGADGAGA
ncbi:hypothetical protein AVW11_16550 [Streptomyces amritsarensis]|uniref:Uncharacterized protein n=1 Tax=Streptomyces amritsarensis TaxID=681158 RepID=A0ABX3G1K8_9ACTN|nr:hypothetical protein [Streptomyces amritsarensis]OLZ65660.1 hypothetical protein AVW11_16550 [Streptomyces amritsarensis]